MEPQAEAQTDEPEARVKRNVQPPPPVQSPRDEVRASRGNRLVGYQNISVVDWCTVRLHQQQAS